MSYKSSINQLENIKLLGPNWDSYKAQPLSQEVQERAWHVLNTVIKYEFPAPWIAAGGDGAIGFQWDSNNWDMYIDVAESYLDVFVGTHEKHVTLETLPNHLAAAKQFIRSVDNLSEDNLGDDKINSLRGTTFEQREAVRKLLPCLFNAWPHRIQTVLPGKGAIGFWLRDLRGNLVDIVCHPDGGAVVSSSTDSGGTGGYQTTIGNLPDTYTLKLIEELNGQKYIPRENRVRVTVSEEKYPPDETKIWAVRYPQLGLTAYGNIEAAARSRLGEMFQQVLDHHRNWDKVKLWLDRMNVEWEFTDANVDLADVVSGETKQRPSLHELKDVI